MDAGIGKPDLPWLTVEADEWEKMEKKTVAQAKLAATTVDSLKLLKFLRATSHVIYILLNIMNFN